MASQPRIQYTLFSVLFMIIIYILCYQFLDQPLALWLKGHEQTWQTVAIIVGHFSSPIIWFSLACTVFAISLLTQKLQLITQKTYYLAMIFSTSIFLAYLVASVLKVTLARYRPELLFSQHLYGFHFFSLKHAYNSTPSGHITGTFAALFSLATLINKKSTTWLLMGLATVLAIFRVMSLAHYLSDVILGAYIGTLACYYAHYLLKACPKFRVLAKNEV